MPVLVLVEARTRPEHTDTMIQGLARGLPGTRRAEGCRSIDVYLEEDGRTVVAVESWDSKDHYQSYLEWREESGALKAMEALLEAPLHIRFLSALDV